MYPTKKLSEVWEIITWNTPSKAKQEFWWWETLFVKPPNLWTDKVVLESEETLSELWRREGKLIKKDSIMVCCIGSLWKIGIAGVDLCTNQQINSIYFNPELVLFKYWYHFCTTLESTLKRLANKAVVQIINKSTFSKIEIPLPPLSTQSRIVARLDSAFASIDEQILLLRENIVDVENMRRSVLEESFQSGDYDLKYLSEVCELITDGSHFSPKSLDSGFPYVTVKDINNIWEIDLIWSKKISEKDYIELCRAGCNPKIGDVLLSKDGTVWKVARVQKDGFVVLSSLAIIRPWKFLDDRLLAYFFKSPEFIRVAIESKTGAAIKRIVLKTIKNFLIPLPPLTRQHEIVAHLDQVFTTTEAMRAEYEVQIRDLEILRQSLLEEAFAGRLVQENEA